MSYPEHDGLSFAWDVEVFECPAVVMSYPAHGRRAMCRLATCLLNVRSLSGRKSYRCLIAFQCMGGARMDAPA